MKLLYFIEGCLMLLGLFVAGTWVLGTAGIGHFRLVYTLNELVCTSDFPQNPLNHTKEHHANRLRQD